MNDNRNCEKCRFFKFSKIDNEWQCFNLFSDNFGCEVKPEDGCKECLPVCKQRKVEVTE